MTNPITALAELAADEPDGSPAAELCCYLAHHVRRRDHETVSHNLDELRKNAADGGDGAHLVLGAEPAQLRRPAPAELPEMVRRAGWLAISLGARGGAERTGAAARAVRAAAHYPSGRLDHLHPGPTAGRLHPLTRRGGRARFL
ncbi:hypothetical protein [Streptomyces sp. N2A]|uniref:hypothetical protein n=1 Tax=Streptomyces sp. N2A TaxID=3073936 RepID=UPI002870AEB4|nr:hypothetical protein [Streptomyces sp. N2A]